MDDSTARWILGVVVAPGLAWATAVIWLLRDIKKGTDKLLDMHEHADEEGFGTRGLNEAFGRMEHTMRELVHYVRWGVEQQAGKVPPPPDPE